jgi:hypothetical protein
VGSFLVSPSATPGELIAGLIVLTYDLYSVSPNDPNFNPNIDTISTGNLISTDAEVKVSTIPEPGTLLLLLSGLGLSWLARLRRRSSGA